MTASGDDAIAWEEEHTQMSEAPTTHAAAWMIYAVT